MGVGFSVKNSIWTNEVRAAINGESSTCGAVDQQGHTRYFGVKVALFHKDISLLIESPRV